MSEPIRRPQSRDLHVVQVTLEESKAYVGDFHAHSGVHTGHKLSLGAVAEGRIVGVAVIGRPSSRVIQADDPWALEVLRVCVERDDQGKGYKNACSFLYGAAWRAIRALGYLRGLTYTKDGESGASCKAAGWVSMDYRRPRTSGWDSREGRKSGGAMPGGERFEIRTATWREGLPGRPVIDIRRVLPGQMELAA